MLKLCMHSIIMEITFLIMENHGKIMELCFLISLGTLCCDGHLLCKACIEKVAKLILAGNKLASVKFYLYNDQTVIFILFLQLSRLLQYSVINVKAPTL